MSSALRTLSRAIGRSVNSTTGKTQTRNIGDLPCKTNAEIEAWSYHKENLEKHFKFTNSNLVTLGLTVVLFPYVVYNLIVADFNKKDDVYGRQRRDFM